MPIKINLLAEQIAAEEAKRRDPIKRAISIGVLLTALMVVWILKKQLDVRSARLEFVGLTNRLVKIEEDARLVKTNQALWMDSERRLTSLNRYATNRFLWGNFLNALQETGLEQIRLIRVETDQRYITNEPARLLATNILVPYVAPPGAWKIWAEPKDPGYLTVVSNEFKVITNSGAFKTNFTQYTTKLTIADTNLIQKMVLVKAEFATVPFSIEQTTVTIRGRDYGQPPGPAITEFEKRLRAHKYFKELLMPGSQGLRILERPPVAQSDPNDPIDPEGRFIPFTIECRFNERVLINE